MKKKVLLFSTLNPYPFWAGSENFWFDFVTDERTRRLFEVKVVLADSPVTRKKADSLSRVGVETQFYRHFHVDFLKRNLYRLADKASKRSTRTLPWYDRIRRESPHLVWFNVSALADLIELVYAARICREAKIPYWLILQHGFENFFLTSEREIETVSEVAGAARRFIFIAKRNQRSLERAIGHKLENAFQSVNALPAAKIREAKKVFESSPLNAVETARFFNLGRFSPVDKAQHVLLESLADAAWRERNWHLTFIGVADFGRIYLEKLIDFYGLEREKVTIKPHTEKVFDEIAQNDVLLMPSLAEGTPFAMIESMACGRPALGTPIGGIPELLVKNETGWLTRTTDVLDVGETLEEVWQQRDKWIEFGKNAQKHIETNYSEEKSFAELLEVLAVDIGE